MYNTGIINLNQISENEWKARYQGNYGIYTIFITTDGKKTERFSCSCPSDYSPCKHISMIEEAIADKILNNKKLGEDSELHIEDFIKNISVEKLREFIITQTKYNSELYKAVLLEFSTNAIKGKGNIYSKIIQQSLASIPDYGDDYYLNEYIDVDVLDQWHDKANEFIRNNQYNEALLLCKACIEEYSQWLFNIGEEYAMRCSLDYQIIFFDIIIGAVDHYNKKELFNYCISEMEKEKYAGTEFYNEFHRLLGILAVTVDPDAYIALQDKLLTDVIDKSSYEAETIIRRKIKLFKCLNQKSKAWSLIRENIQIESFCLKVVNKKIEKQKYSIAKKLINDFLDNRKENQKKYFNKTWNGLLLDIAQKENDIPMVKKLSYMFIEGSFIEKYYQIYKAVFIPLEWIDEKEKLFLHYCNKKYFIDSAANLLVAENETERLINYVEKYLSIDNLLRYYKYFESNYPGKTLEFFSKSLTSYAANNTGRKHYEYINSVLKKMSVIKGGKKAVSELVESFIVQYKNRKAMMEVLKEL